MKNIHNLQTTSLDKFRINLEHYMEEVADGASVCIEDEEGPLFYLLDSSYIDDTIENIEKLKHPRDYTPNLTQAQETLIQFKQRFHFFKDIRDVDLANICTNIRIIQLQKGEVVFEKEDPGHEIYFIIKGSIDVSFENKSKTLESEEVFGEVGFLTKSPRRANAIVRSQTANLLRFNIKAQTHSHDESVYTQLYKNFAQILSERLVEVSS